MEQKPLNLGSKLFLGCRCSNVSGYIFLDHMLTFSEFSVDYTALFEGDVLRLQSESGRYLNNLAKI